MVAAELQELREVWRRCGPRGLLHVISKRVRRRNLRFADEVAAAVTGATVLEVGGPSSWFRAGSPMPVYDHARSVDNVNYAGATLWESGLEHGGAFAPAARVIGTQWLCEAGDLGDLGPYDVVISSHTIEHTSNPLRALREWRRVTRDGGSLLLVVPHRDGTFDHRRPVTSLDHLRADEADEVDESDRTHVEEILSLHDVDRDPGLTSIGQLQERVADNLSTRSMHHHVFDTAAVWDMVSEAGWSPWAVEAVWPHDVVLLARNGSPGSSDPGAFPSPFPSDRRRQA